MLTLPSPHRPLYLPSMHNNEDAIPDPPEEDILEGQEILNDNKPIPLAPEEGLRLMRLRLETLNTNLSLAETDAEIQSILAQLNDTKLRLASYQLQADSRN